MAHAFSIKRSRLIRVVSFAATAGALLTVACEDEAPAAGGRGVRGAAAPANAAASAAGAGGEQTALKAAVAYKDDDFVESMTNRDPFKSYTTSFTPEGPSGVETQRRVYMPTTSVEEMRLIALVTGVPKPKAMLVDPLGVGHVVERGDYVGRPKIVQASGNVAMQLNWRVDRIRENEVVLTQEDAADPTRTALTKIIPLRDEKGE